VAATALALWALTASIGFYMFGTSIGIARPLGEQAKTHWPSWLVFLHPTFAVAGLGIYMVYLGYDIKPLAWVAFADLLLVAVLGDVLLVSWLKARRNELKAVRDPEHQEVARVRNYAPRPQQGRVQVTAPDTVPVTELDERRIPPVAVAAHGTLAVITIVMVLLVCLGV
jgi:hypothetical protein